MFDVYINCVLFSTNINLNKRYVLSIEKDSIILPSFLITQDNIQNIDHSIIEFLKQLVFVNDLELLPQLININTKVISDNINRLDIIYGFIINHTGNINNCHWVEFDLLQEQQYSQLLFEVIQKLR